MKRFLLCHVSLGLALLSAEPTQDDSPTAASLPDPASIRFTPPPPPKEVPPMEVKGSVTADFGTHRITILRGEPSTLPDIPEPPPPAETPRESSFAPGEPVHVLIISGSTFGDSLCHIEIWNPVTRTRHTAWCGWDVSLIAPFHEITHQGKTHAILMGVGPGVARDDHPMVEPGSILVPDGDDYTASVLTSLRDACLQNLPKLLQIKTAREQYQKDAAAWRAANPPRPQNHTIWIKPHRGSRYLPESTDDQKEGIR
jgi:hypothetical protein